MKERDQRLAIAKELARFVLDDPKQPDERERFVSLSQAPICDQLQTWATDLREASKNSKPGQMPLTLLRNEVSRLSWLMQQAADALRGRAQ